VFQLASLRDRCLESTFNSSRQNARKARIREVVDLERKGKHQTERGQCSKTGPPGVPKTEYSDRSYYTIHSNKEQLLEMGERKEIIIAQTHEEDKRYWCRKLASDKRNSHHNFSEA